MTVEAYVPAVDYRADRAAAFSSPFARRWVLALSGCAVMALSGAGLAGYLDLSSASAADAPATSTVSSVGG